MAPAPAGRTGKGKGQTPPLEALEQARRLLAAHGIPSGPPTGPTFAAKPLPPSAALNKMLAEAMDKPGSSSDDTMRLLQPQLMQQIASTMSKLSSGGSSNDGLPGRGAIGGMGGIDADGLLGGGDGMVKATRGTENMNRLQAHQVSNPAAWNQAFDDELAVTLRTRHTGRPASLFDFVLHRMRFEAWQETEERVCHILAELHSTHTLGTESHDELGRQIRQAFKSTDQYVRDKDWTLAWTWLNIPDPRPKTRFRRGLAQPSEFAAGIAYVREQQVLETYQQQQATARRDAKGKTRESWKGGGGPATEVDADGAPVVTPKGGRGRGKP